jgi:hypothetical protein
MAFFKMVLVFVRALILSRAKLSLEPLVLRQQLGDSRRAVPRPQIRNRFASQPGFSFVKTALSKPDSRIPQILAVRLTCTSYTTRRGIRLSVQYCSQVWSKLLITVNEGGYRVGPVEMTEGWTLMLG